MNSADGIADLQPRQNDFSDPIAPYVRTDYVALPADLTVGQVLEDLRRREIGEQIVYFYVVDAENRLLGVLPVRRLLISPPGAVIRAIMVPRVISLPRTANVMLASELFALHRFLALPVVDEDKKLVGVVDISLFTDEVISIGEAREARELEKVFQWIGVHASQQQPRSAWTSFRARFPWLLCNMVGGLVCAWVVGLYEPFIKMVTLLALFIPIVLAMAESVSMQSMTLALQYLPHGPGILKSVGRVLRREFLSSLALGIGCMLVVGLMCFAWKHETAVALAVGGSVGLAVVTASLVGVAVPALVRVFRIDPKIASGPVVLAIADICTLLLYFRLAAWVFG